MDPVTFWSAVGPIGTCVAAVAAVIALGPKSKRIKGIQLNGRWKGDLGDEWAFLAHLRVDNGRVEGNVHWKMTECPPSLPWAQKVGASGSELVEGTLGRGTLAFSGKKVLASDPDLFGLLDYMIPLPASGDAFDGRGEPQQKKGKYAEGGALRGTISFSRKAPPDTE